jgi:hypothetical protein
MTGSSRVCNESVGLKERCSIVGEETVFSEE